MFYVKVGDSAMVYTGDYNMTPDRHLGAAQIDRLQLDLLITEYGTYVCSLLSSLCNPICNVWNKLYATRVKLRKKIMNAYGLVFLT